MGEEVKVAGGCEWVKVLFSQYDIQTARIPGRSSRAKISGIPEAPHQRLGMWSAARAQLYRPTITEMQPAYR